MSERGLRALLVAGGLANLALGLAQALAPGAFHEAAANFGPRNDHFLRDFATFYLAAGPALLIAARRPSWRLPVLVLVTAEYALHAVNHLIDIGDADPAWVGPADFVSLVAGALVFGYLAFVAGRSPAR